MVVDCLLFNLMDTVDLS